MHFSNNINNNEQNLCIIKKGKLHIFPYPYMNESHLLEAHEVHKYINENNEYFLIPNEDLSTFKSFYKDNKKVNCNIKNIKKILNYIWKIPCFILFGFFIIFLLLFISYKCSNKENIIKNISNKIESKTNQSIDMKNIKDSSFFQEYLENIFTKISNTPVINTLFILFIKIFHGLIFNLMILFVSLNKRLTIDNANENENENEKDLL